MDIKSLIEESISDYIQSKYDSEIATVQITNTRQKEHGDLSTNIAMILSKKFSKNPREFATELSENVRWPEAISKVDIAGPGFLNFFVSQDSFIDILEEIHDKKENFGRNLNGKGKSVNIEFVSANPTGPLTVGHCRNAVLGDTFARIMEANGYRVDREYYFNNAGRQMRMLGYSVYYRYKQIFDPNIDFPEEHYEGDYIKDIAQKIKEKYADRLIDDIENPIFMDSAEQEIFLNIKRTLDRIGIIHDVFYNEKDLYETGKIQNVLNAFKEKDLSYNKEGATWLKTTDLGFDSDRVIIKSSGEPTYRLPDIAYHIEKFKRNYDLIIDIFGADHIDSYPDVLAANKALGFDIEKVKVVIYQFVTLLRNNEVVKMSTRKANFVTMDELIDEVGKDVVRYFINMRNVNTHLNFDLDLAKKQSDENPVFYVQYAHARICSIHRRANEKGLSFSPKALELLKHENEKDLIKKLQDYPEIVEKLADNLEQHKLCNYVYDLAGLYHKFNQSCKVIDLENKALSEARLYLIEAVRQVLENALSLIGVSAPKKM